MLYFAYGANMDEETLAERGIDFKFVCTGRVKDVRLVFHMPGDDGTGKADLVADRKSHAHGIVYDVPESTLANLDVYEHIDRGHYRRELVTVKTAQGELDCICYRATKFKTGLKPNPAYLERLVKGAQVRQLPEHYLVFLKSHDTMAVKG